MTMFLIFYTVREFIRRKSLTEKCKRKRGFVILVDLSICALELNSEKAPDIKYYNSVVRTVRQ